MTFSGGEELAYDIQGFKRGIVVGETSGGGANPGDPQAIGRGFMVFMPFGIVVHPATGKNWEGVGVKPDVPVPASLALLEAYRLAVERVQQGTEDARDRAALAALSENLKQEKSSAAQSAVTLLAKSLTEFTGFYTPVGGGGPRYWIELKEGSLVLRPTSTKPPSKLVPIGDNKYQLDGLPDGATATFSVSGAGSVNLLLQQAHWIAPMLFEKKQSPDPLASLSCAAALGPTY
jgi:hypothetical protein